MPITFFESVSEIGETDPGRASTAPDDRADRVVLVKVSVDS